MNVSRAANHAFLEELKEADPIRFANWMNNIRRDLPGEDMSEDQALTNFMLGLPTGKYRFEVIAGAPAPTPVNRVVDRPGAITQRTCLGCSRTFLVTRRQENRVFHSDACHAKTTEKYAAQGIMRSGWKACAVCGGPFRPERMTEKYCKRTWCQSGIARRAAIQSQPASERSLTPA